jgi:hypothetical protein
VTKYCVGVFVGVLYPSVVDSDPTCHFDVDPDPTFHFDADPGPDPSFQLKAQTLKSANFPYILACHLQINADPDPAYHFDAYPDPAYHVDADPDPRCFVHFVERT